MNIESTTAPAANPTGKLIGWASLISLLIAANYAINLTTHPSKADTDKALFEYSTAVGSAFIYLVLFSVVLAIANDRRDLLALRQPRSWVRALGLALAVLLVAGFVISILDSFLHGGREQGVVPPHWIPGHTGAYVANWIAIAGIAPFVEELTFRGLGFGLLSPLLGVPAAIVSIGLVFAASHGLVQAFPELAIFGIALAWLRYRVNSVFPGMLVHCAFNSFALASVFWH